MTFEEALECAKMLNPLLVKEGIKFAVTGGFAVLLHLNKQTRDAYQREIFDIDYNVDVKDIDKFRKVLSKVKDVEVLAGENFSGQFRIGPCLVEYHRESKLIDPTQDVDGVRVRARDSLIADKRPAPGGTKDKIDVIVLEEGFSARARTLMEKYRAIEQRRDSTDSNESKGKRKLGVMDAALDHPEGFAGDENDNYASDEELGQLKGSDW